MWLLQSFEKFWRFTLHWCLTRDAVHNTIHCCPPAQQLSSIAPFSMVGTWLWNGLSLTLRLFPKVLIYSFYAHLKLPLLAVLGSVAFLQSHLEGVLSRCYLPGGSSHTFVLFDSVLVHYK